MAIVVVEGLVLGAEVLVPERQMILVDARRFELWREAYSAYENTLYGGP